MSKSSCTIQNIIENERSILRNINSLDTNELNSPNKDQCQIKNGKSEVELEIELQHGQILFQNNSLFKYEIIRNVNILKHEKYVISLGDKQFKLFDINSQEEYTIEGNYKDLCLIDSLNHSSFMVCSQYCPYIKIQLFIYKFFAGIEYVRKHSPNSLFEVIHKTYSSTVMFYISYNATRYHIFR